MARIVPFRDRYLEEARALDPFLALEIRSHPDVVPGTALAAFGDAGRGKAVLTGFGFLSRNPFDRFTALEFGTDVRSEAGIDAADALLDALAGLFLKTRDGDRAVLRLWCRESQEAYRAFLKEHGFAVRDRMRVMERPLAGTLPPAGADGEVRDVTGRILEDAGYLARYLELNKAAFGYQDSPGELIFRIRHCGGRVFSIIEGGADPAEGSRAFVTVWPMENGAAATENVFCDPARQRRGFTGRLLGAVLRMLAAEGFLSARLNVYEDDAPALALYGKLGYHDMYRLLEMHGTAGADREDG